MSIEHTEPIRLRTACEEDAEALLDIYAPYVEHTALSMRCPLWKSSESASAA